ncbi:phosphotransferase [Tenggerimyces flavus]|uniref:Phosphotransferase n=1 Tax=Tenggerimyces flavus TaxID=1708749 RepID=A0ABV7YQV0_9ACTN|nr:phosphotransferase [Tenggerimyces flavus]MBM7786345.1 hypothetical protein [Tenggerimyces flavus]
MNGEYGVEAWLDEQLAKAGRQRTGDITQPRVRPWGAIWHAPTDQGDVWLKAPGRRTAFEVGLYEILQRAAPDHILEPIAADTDHGWLLLPDGGIPVREQLGEHDLIDTLEKVLPQYAQLQRALAPHVDAMLEAGVTDMRPNVMPQRFDEAFEAAERYVTDSGTEEDRVNLQAVKAKRAQYVDWCQRLQSAKVPASLDHNDLHLANVFMTNGQARFYDWGDAVVAHPFASMFIGLGMIGIMRGVKADSPDVTRARDAYLEPFTDLAPHKDLVEELETAVWVSKPARALVWERSIDGHESEFADAPYQTMCGLLRDSWIQLC